MAQKPIVPRAPGSNPMADMQGLAGFKGDGGGGNPADLETFPQIQSGVQSGDRGLGRFKGVNRKGAPGKGRSTNPRDMIQKAAARRLQGS